MRRWTGSSRTCGKRSTSITSGLTLAETAAALDVASSTVKHRLRRAVHELQARLLSPVDHPPASTPRLSP